MQELNKDIKVLLLSILQRGMIGKKEVESLTKYFVDNKLVENPLILKVIFEDFNE